MKIYVRRGGPNYQAGLQMMVDCGEQTGLPIEVFGPETHLTSVVSYALGIKQATSSDSDYDSKFTIKNDVGSALTRSSSSGNLAKSGRNSTDQLADLDKFEDKPWHTLFTKNTEAVIYGMQPKAVQNMLDFDHVCSRKKPSVVAMIYPFSGMCCHVCCSLSSSFSRCFVLSLSFNAPSLVSGCSSLRLCSRSPTHSTLTIHFLQATTSKNSTGAPKK